MAETPSVSRLRFAALHGFTYVGNGWFLPKHPEIIKEKQAAIQADILRGFCAMPAGYLADLEKRLVNTSSICCVPDCGFIHSYEKNSYK